MFSLDEPSVKTKIIFGKFDPKFCKKEQTFLAIFQPKTIFNSAFEKNREFFPVFEQHKLPAASQLSGQPSDWLADPASEAPGNTPVLQVASIPSEICSPLSHQLQGAGSLQDRSCSQLTTHPVSRLPANILLQSLQPGPKKFEKGEGEQSIFSLFDLSQDVLETEQQNIPETREIE